MKTTSAVAIPSVVVALMLLDGCRLRGIHKGQENVDRQKKYSQKDASCEKVMIK